MFYPRGEEVAARAAGDAGTVYILSTLSGCRLEDVKRATRGPAWYQLYLVGGRDVALALDRARQAAGYSALVVTIDTPVAGLRERDVRNGIKELLTRRRSDRCCPSSAVPGAPALARGVPGRRRPDEVSQRRAAGRTDAVRRRRRRARAVGGDVARSRGGFATPGTVRSSSKACTPATMRGRAIDAGAGAVVVSNHGGRQLDGVRATLRVLPEVVAAVDGQIEVLLDGGIRRGGDIVKALCLGARAVLVGRAYAYGLGAAGGAGVARAIEILRADLVRTMKLLGCPGVTALDPSYLDVPADWLVDAQRQHTTV